MGIVEDEAEKIVDSIMKNDHLLTYEKLFKAGQEAGKECPPEGCSIEQIEKSCLEALKEMGLVENDCFYSGKLFSVFKAGVEYKS